MAQATEKAPQVAEQETPKQAAERLMAELAVMDKEAADALSVDFKGLEKAQQAASATWREAYVKDPDIASVEAQNALDAMGAANKAVRDFAGKVTSTMANLDKIQDDRLSAYLSEQFKAVLEDPDVVDHIVRVKGSCQSISVAYNYPTTKGEGDEVVQVPERLIVKVNGLRPASTPRPTSSGERGDRVVLPHYSDPDHPLSRKRISKDSLIEVDGVTYRATDLNKEFGTPEMMATSSWVHGDKNLPAQTANTVWDLAENRKAQVRLLG